MTGSAVLLGRQFGQLALGLARRPELPARETEVHDAHAAVLAEHHVFGLEVAVYQPRVMGGGEPLARGDVRRENFVHRSHLGADPSAQCDAVHELHRQEHAAIVGSRIVNGHHVGMGELGQRLGFAKQTVAPIASVAFEGFALDEFERHLSIKLRIVGAVHDRHAALSELLEDDVPTDGGSRVESLGLGDCTADIHCRFDADRRRRPRLAHRLMIPLSPT